MVESYRQKVLWLTPLGGGSVSLAMDSEESQFKRTLGATILELRVGIGISSQKELGRQVGVSEATVRRWEKGTHAPDAWEVNRLCQLFGVESDELIHPKPLTEREHQLLRRVARQAHRTIDRENEAS